MGGVSNQISIAEAVQVNGIIDTSHSALVYLPELKSDNRDWLSFE